MISWKIVRQQKKWNARAWARRVRCAHCKAEAEVARQLEEDRRKAAAARRRAQDEAFALLLQEDQRKAQDAHRRAIEEQEERESKERERHERERRECESPSVTESVHPSLAQRLRIYEYKWDARRNNRVALGQLGFSNVPWSVFEDVRRVDDITRERVLAFVYHPLHEGGGQAKVIRSEILRWHPNKFNGKVLPNIIEGDRDGEAVRETAGHVARILTTFSAENW